MQHRGGLQKELRLRGVPLNTIVTTDNYDSILITKESLITIANHVSAAIKRKVTQGEVSMLLKFIRSLRSDTFYGMKLAEAQKSIADKFLTREQDMLAGLEEQDDDAKLSGVREVTDEGTFDEYQKKEIMQLSKDETRFKTTAFPDRRGNAIIDRARVEGTRSSPNNIKGVSQQDATDVTYNAMRALQNFLDPESVEDLINKLRDNELHTYDDISLVHQTLQLDSRNRLQNNTSNEYKWNIHAAGMPGHLGDVRIQDTLQQVIEVKVRPFWIPFTGPLDTYYGTIRMLIKEFYSQSIQVTEFLDPLEGNPKVSQYHFEFEIKQQDLNRIFLKPKHSTYRFRKPFARVETLTITFSTPYSDLTLLPDRGNFTMTYGNPTLFTSPNAHNLSTGDLVYIINASTGDSSIDAELNRPQGQIVTRVDDFNFTIQVDTSSLVGTETNIHVFYGSKRIVLPLEFTSLEQ
jgi:hypothetical protein